MMARDAQTYRGARRNACIRELKGEWGPAWYYTQHRNAPRWAQVQGVVDRNNQAPIYVPREKIERKKGDPRGSAIHALIRGGRYAEAVRAFFSRKGKASGRGG